MISAHLDTILMIAGGVFILLSVVLNIAASLKISRFTDTLIEMENRMAVNAQKSESPGRSATTDSSVVPGAEDSEPDHRTRYRPPGSTVTSIPTENGSDQYAAPVDMPVPEGPAAEPEATPTPAPPIQPEPAAQNRIAPSRPEFRQATPEEQKPDSSLLKERERELLKEYLGTDSDLLPREDTVPDSAETEESEVMEVIEDSTIIDTRAPSGSKEPKSRMEINPFDNDHQSIDFERLNTALNRLTEHGTLVLDFSDIFLLTESEIQQFQNLQSRALAKKTAIQVKHIPAEVENALFSAVPGIVKAESDL